MPREDRRIIFDYSEAYQALYALCVQKELKRPPPGAIRACAFKAGDDQILQIDVVNSQENMTAAIEYSRDFVAAALMRFCRGSGVPLPKKALKSVELGQEIVILRVMI